MTTWPSQSRQPQKPMIFCLRSILSIPNSSMQRLWSGLPRTSKWICWVPLERIIAGGRTRRKAVPLKASQSTERESKGPIRQERPSSTGVPSLASEPMRSSRSSFPDGIAVRVHTKASAPGRAERGGYHAEARRHVHGSKAAAGTQDSWEFKQHCAKRVGTERTIRALKKLLAKSPLQRTFQYSPGTRTHGNCNQHTPREQPAGREILGGFTYIRFRQTRR